MNTGGLAQMSYNSFPSSSGLGLPSGGLASRRGGQSIRPLTIDSLKCSTGNKENGVPTPRTSRSHLLAGLRTAPKSATTSTFPQSPTSTMPPSQQTYGRNNLGVNMYGGQENGYTNAPKTSLPRIQTQQQAYKPLMSQQYQNYTPDQILAPEIHLDEQVQEQMDPSMYAQLVATNMYLAQQQQRLQQQLLHIQAAAQQFQGLNLNGQAMMQHQLAIQNVYQQQQQIKNLQQTMVSSMQPQQTQQIYTYVDPATGHQAYVVDHNQALYNQQLNNMYMEQPATPQNFSFQQNNTPRVQVSPPPNENEKPFFHSNSPTKKLELTAEPTPLPPPSANAFRRGHKKSSSVATKALSLSADEPLKSAGPRSAGFPLSPLSNGYGPGQARAGEHPIRQPRGPPSIDELRAKPTARHVGSKNFATSTRRSAVHDLVRAGMERRKGTRSTGSMSSLSESAEEAGALFTDNESDSGRSGSGSLSGDAEPSVASSRTSTSGSWGAIGSDRPSSRQKSRKSVDSLSSACESDESFAGIFKNGSHQFSKPEMRDGQRKTPLLMLTSAEKRKNDIIGSEQ